MENSKNISTFKAAIAILFSFAMVVTAITPTTLEEASAQSAADNRIFESQEDGFRLQIPQGWVIQDDDIITPSDQSFDTVSMLCLENEALPGIGGEHNCQSANLTDSITINRFLGLQSRPEFQDIVEPPTTNDLLALWIQMAQNYTSNTKIENTTDVDEFRKIATLTYQLVENAGTFVPWDDFTYNVDSIIMFALSQDRNTGYNIVNSLAIPNIYNQTEHTPAMQQVLNSFEVIE